LKNSKKYHKLRDNSTSGNATNATNGTAGTSDRPNMPVIPFDTTPASKVDPNINVVGEKVDTSVTLTDFPFKISRCDQIALFQCSFINNDNDYRVRVLGYMAITAYYTNLYADKDGQKLIQQVMHTEMTILPQLIQGADGCVLIGGDKGQKKMRICVPSKANAVNLLDLYKDFTRCRLGDNLTAIPAKHLQNLMSLCNVDKKRLLTTAGPIKNVQAGGMSMSGVMSQSQDQSQIKQNLRNKKHKKNKPQFDFPDETDNKWEKERLQYFMPGKLRVPGDKIHQKLPGGLTPGLIPIDNPGVLPASPVPK
jgi:hypothetical protein